MSQTYALDALIKEVDKKKYKPQEWERIKKDKIVVFIDTVKNEILQSIPWISIGKNIKTFIISPEETVEVSGIEVSIRDFELDQNLTLEILYQASLSEGGHEKLVRVVSQETNPEVAIRRQIESWVRKISKREDKFMQNYQQIEGKLKREIASNAEEYLGLEMNIIFKLQGKVSLENENIDDQVTKIYVKDYDEELLIQFNAVINVVSNQNPNYIYAAAKRDLKKLRIEYITKVISELTIDFNLQYLIDNLDSEIKSLLFNKINDFLATHGRELIKLNLKLIDVIQADKLSEEFGFDIEYGKDKYPKPITITSKVKMNLVDMAKFKKQRIVELREWVNKQLTDLIGTHLFHATYVDLVLAFSNNQSPEQSNYILTEEGLTKSYYRDVNLNKDYRTAIIQDFSQRAIEIGYQVNVLIVDPLLPELIYAKEGFSLSSEEKDYATKTPDISVKIQFVINGRINNLKTIEKLINEKIDIRARIEKRAEDIIAEIVHNLSPSDAIIEFYNFIEIPVKNHLEKILFNDFALDPFTCSIIIKQGNDKLLQRIKNLVQGVKEMKITIKPKYKIAAGEEFEYNLTYKIRGVHPDYWYIFQNNNIDSVEKEVADIEKIFAEVVRSGLEKDPTRAQEVIKQGMSSVVKASGLIMEPLSLRENETIAGRANSELYLQKIKITQQKQIESLENRLEHKKNQIDELEKKRMDLLKSIDVDEDAKNQIEIIDNEINKLKDDIAIPMDTDPTANLLPPSVTFDPDLLLENIIDTSRSFKSNNQEDESQN